MIVNTNDKFNDMFKIDSVNPIYQFEQRQSNSNSNNSKKNNSQINFDKIFKEIERE